MKVGYIHQQIRCYLRLSSWLIQILAFPFKSFNATSWTPLARTHVTPCGLYWTDLVQLCFQIVDLPSKDGLVNWNPSS